MIGTGGTEGERLRLIADMIRAVKDNERLYYPSELWTGAGGTLRAEVMDAKTARAIFNALIKVAECETESTAAEGVVTLSAAVNQGGL